MSDPASFLVFIPGLPLLAAAVTAFFGPRHLRNQSHWPVIVASAVSCILSLLVLASVPLAEGQEWRRYYTWFHAGAVDVGFTLRADTLTAVMLVTVTFIGTLIAVYSVGYMHGDPGYARFFAEIGLFIFSMTG